MCFPPLQGLVLEEAEGRTQLSLPREPVCFPPLQGLVLEEAEGRPQLSLPREPDFHHPRPHHLQGFVLEEGRQQRL